MHTQVGRMGCHDENVWVRAGGGGLKTGKYVSILIVYFPFLKIFSKKKKKTENDWGNKDFVDITYE